MKYLHSLATAVILSSTWAWAEAQEPSPTVDQRPNAAPNPKPDSDLPKIVMLTNGRMLTGQVKPHKDGGWNVQQKLGVIHVVADDVEGIFPTLKAVYEYKRELLPPRDIQERMRLYQWCMTQNLLTDAREQLQAVLALSSEHEEAKSLLSQIDIRIARNDVRSDNQVLRTSATQPSAREMDPPFLSKAFREMSVKTNPIIFDLPEAFALKRAQEFNQYVHPLLQRFCADCHNERTPNGFGLISVKGQAARDPAIQRANLDATLKLVDPANLMQSQLLTNSLLPHQPNNQPIFPGPNNAAYRLISNWVSNLQHRGFGAPTPKVESNVGARSADPGVMPAEVVTNSGGFGVEGRTATQQVIPIEPNPNANRPMRSPLPAEDIDAPEPTAPGRLVPGSYNGAQPMAPKGTKFPVPLQSGASVEEVFKRMQAEEAEQNARIEAVNKAKLEKQKAGELPQAAPDNAKPGSTKPDSKPAKKPVKIDQDMLDKFMMNRRAGGG